MLYQKLSAQSRLPVWPAPKPGSGQSWDAAGYAAHGRFVADLATVLSISSTRRRASVFSMLVAGMVL